MPNLTPRRNFLQQMSMCIIYLMLCALYFQTDALYFHDHIKSLPTHGISPENVALDVVNPKNSYTVILQTVTSPFPPSNEREVLKLLFPSSLPCFLHIEGITCVSKKLFASQWFTRYLFNCVSLLRWYASCGCSITTVLTHNKCSINICTVDCVTEIVPSFSGNWYLYAVI